MSIKAGFGTIAICLAAAMPLAAKAVDTPATQAIHIDVPVVLKDAKVLYNMDHSSAMTGDQPVGLTYMSLTVKKFQKDHTSWKMVAVFHNTMAYLLLNDAAYNKARKTSHGNPYKDQVAALIKEGVQIEECAVSMKNNGWTNADVLPDVKVNSGAVGRIVQLVQDGYVQLEP